MFFFFFFLLHFANATCRNVFLFFFIIIFFYLFIYFFLCFLVINSGIRNTALKQIHLLIAFWMGFPHVIILHYHFRRVYRYNITNPNIPNFFLPRIYRFISSWTSSILGQIRQYALFTVPLIVSSSNLQVNRSIKSQMVRILVTSILVLTSELPTLEHRKNIVDSKAPSVLIGSSSNLQVTRTGIKFWTSLILGQIGVLLQGYIPLSIENVPMD